MKKHAFTLIEIIVVVSIVLIMAALGVGSYRAARQNITIDLEADKLMTTLFALRDLSTVKAKCFGARLERGKEPQKIEADFNRALNNASGSGPGGCDLRGERRSILPWSPEVEVTNEGISILFMPPHGKIQIFPTMEAKEVNLALKNMPQVARTIIINPASEKIEKK